MSAGYPSTIGIVDRGHGQGPVDEWPTHRDEQTVARVPADEGITDHEDEIGACKKKPHGH